MVLNFRNNLVFRITTTPPQGWCNKTGERADRAEDALLSAFISHINLQHCKIATAIITCQINNWMSFIYLTQEAGVSGGEIRGYRYADLLYANGSAFRHSRMGASKDLPTMLVNYLCDSDITAKANHEKSTRRLGNSLVICLSLQ